MRPQISITAYPYVQPKKVSFFVVLFSFFSCCFSTFLFSQQNYSITINNIPKQKLLSVGSSSVGLQDGVPNWATEAMADSIYKSLGFNALRLWSNTEQSQTANDMLVGFDYYIQSGILDAARKRGVQVLLLAPMRYGETPTEPMEEYTEKLAEFIRRLKSEKGVVINVTGVANEPGFTVAQMTDAVKLLRQKLDIKGLQNVGIVAPEASSADARGFSLVQGIKDDPIAWKGLLGIASHSYNMAANKQWENSITGTAKQYWMTEASDNGNETANDDTRAATIAARFLNDMNHLVDNWYFFIGYSSSSDVTTDGDNATKLMVYDLRSRKIFEHLKYYYFKQIRTIFDYNAVFRDAVSATEGDMVYTYGQKPAINCAAAKNPDGSWGIGAVNLTGINATFFGETYYPAATYNVTIYVKELANVASTNFRLYRSSASKRFYNDGIVTMRNGSVTVTITPKELISLRSISSSLPTTHQIINFAPLSSKTFGDPLFNITAKATSGLPVSFRIVSGPATLSGNTITLTGVGTVEIEASQTGNGNYNAATPVKQSFIVTGADVPSACGGMGSILYEQWNNIGGNNLHNISFFQTAPASSNQLNSFEELTDIADNFGSRIRGYICPPQSGNYTFWVAGDDASELWLSTNENPANKIRIANILSWSNPREWNKFPSQKSVQIYLQSGQRYYVEAVHKEGGGGDNLSVAWQLPSGAMEAPIPGSRLIPYSVSDPVAKVNQSISFASIPAKTLGVAPFNINATATSGLPVSFHIVSGPATVAANVVTLTGVGSVVVEASQNGNPAYNAAPNAIQNFVVNGAASTSECSATGTVYREQWSGIDGNDIAVIPFQTLPTSSAQLTVLESLDAGVNYGARIRGYICPPASGDYTFYLSGDDAAELWLSSNDNVTNKVKIAGVSSWTGIREWTRYSTQKSISITLIKGRRYYIEVLHKQGGGAGHLSVAWQLPGGVIEAPIPATRLSPYVTTSVSKVGQAIIFEPISNKTVGGAPFKISATASSGLPVSFNIVSGPATVSGNTVTILGVGSVLIEASQPGNATYNPAPASTKNFAVGGVSGATDCSATGSILRERWNGIDGNDIANIPLEKVSSSTGELTVLETVDPANNYGERFRGYICAPRNGDYTFFIAGDDAAELWLSMDENSATRVKIASVLSWTEFREWTRYSSQKSASITLIKGHRYYIEVLHKQGAGGGHVSVGWQLPGGVMEAPIPGTRLSPYSANSVSKLAQTTSLSPIFDELQLISAFVVTKQTTDGLSNNAFSIFPNPTIGTLTVQLKDIKSSKITVQIFTANGTLVSQKSTLQPANVSSKTFGFDLSNNPAGIYLVKIISSEGVKIGKIVKSL